MKTSEKLDFLRGQKKDPYYSNFKPSISIRKLYDKNAENDETFAIAGRMMLKRHMGRASFLEIKDVSGTIQAYVSSNRLGTEEYDDFINCSDLGDVVGITGVLFFTKTGQLTLNASSVEIVAKILSELPDKFHGVQNKETIYRQRYLDLIMNPHSLDVFKKRSLIIKTIRSVLEDLDFIEVETPMLHHMPTGAKADPFTTFHKSLNIPLYLRIAPELFLKQLIVGGLERVYEMNRSFRNEGISSRHNPEFTTLECYQAYSDYKDMINLTEKIFRTLSYVLHGSGKIHYKNQLIDFDLPFKKIRLIDSIKEHYPDHQDLTNLGSLQKMAESLNVNIEEKFINDIGYLQTEIFDQKISDILTEPTFVTHYPTISSPLAKQEQHDPQLVERFELFICGMEFANAYSELNNPVLQEQRFKEQGEDSCDYDYVNALAYGMPPTSGLGLGIDRMVMLFTQQANIRDVIFFPTLKPMKKDL